MKSFCGDLPRRDTAYSPLYLPRTGTLFRISDSKFSFKIFTVDKLAIVETVKHTWSEWIWSVNTAWYKFTELQILRLCIVTSIDLQLWEIFQKHVTNTFGIIIRPLHLVFILYRFDKQKGMYFLKKYCSLLRVLKLILLARSLIGWCSLCANPIG